MIKRTEVNQQKTPTVMKNKNPYSNKGSVPLKNNFARINYDSLYLSFSTYAVDLV